MNFIALKLLVAMLLLALLGVAQAQVPGGTGGNPHSAGTGNPLGDGSRSDQIGDLLSAADAETVSRFSRRSCYVYPPARSNTAVFDNTPALVPDLHTAAPVSPDVVQEIEHRKPRPRRGLARLPARVASGLSAKAKSSSASACCFACTRDTEHPIRMHLARAPRRVRLAAHPAVCHGCRMHDAVGLPWG